MIDNLNRLKPKTLTMKKPWFIDMTASHKKKKKAKKQAIKQWLKENMHENLVDVI